MDQSGSISVKPESCLAKITDSNEPVFVLRARDLVAADTVRTWASLATAAGVPEEKIEQARAIADLMDQWPEKKVPD